MSTHTWNIDVAHSGINFSVRHMVVSKVRGRFTDWKGTLELDADALENSKIDVEIDAASIDTNVQDRDNHLRSGDFLDAEHYPKITYKSSKIQKKSDDEYEVLGELTIRDVTRKVPLQVEFGGRAKDPWGNERVGFTARTKVERKDFGLTWNQALEAGGVLVGDRLDIDIELEAVLAQ